METNEAIKQILHDLDHQKMEAIGVEELVRQSIPLITSILITVRFSDVHLCQILAVLRTVHELLGSDMCVKCKEMSDRIFLNMVEDYRDWESKREQK